MLRRGMWVAGLMVGMAFASPAQAQIAWESPMLVAPRAPAGMGIFLMDPWPGSGIGVMGTYRTAPTPVGLGFRAGIGEGRGSRLAIFGGVDISGYVLRATPDVPLDVLWFTGAGLGVGRDALISFPLGLSVGGELDADGVVFRPYAAPRVVLDGWMGDSRPPRNDNQLNLDLAVDLGLDLAFDPSWLIRFAATVGQDRTALLIGVAFPY